jgi:ubiquinone/menaquinone biosynthesis C-methylase UbiE
LSLQKWHHADETKRSTWQNAEAVLTEAGLKPGMTFMDIGCGQGYFALPAARIVGSSGKVYGLDIDNTGIQELRKKAETEGLHNLELLTGAAEDSLFCSGCADVIFFGIVLHDFADPSKVLENSRKMIKPDGRLVDLDWRKIEMSFGPPLVKRFNEETASRLIESSGYKIESVKNSGKYYYVITARPY